jgi:hypothetical protein
MSEMMAIKLAAESSSAPLSALIWWFIPLTAAIGAACYVIWVTKFQKKYENKTERSVGRFQSFQKSFKTRDSDKEQS